MNDPFFIVFSLRLDNGYHVWVQCKYERVYTLCFSCERIGHKTDTCMWTPPQTSEAMHNQLVRVREVFGVRIAVDPTYVHFVDEAKAFTDYPSRRTIRIHLNFVNGHMKHFPYDI